MTTVLGVDPGVRGGFALLHPDGRPAMVVGLRPETTEKELIDHLRDAVTFAHRLQTPCVCYMEKVGYIRGDGGKGAFTFGGVYKFLRGVLLTLNVPIHDVYPAIWQARMECLSGGNKNVTKERAKALFPTQEGITHAVADALLIAAYGRRALGLTPFV